MGEKLKGLMLSWGARKEKNVKGYEKRKRKKKSIKNICFDVFMEGVLHENICMILKIFWRFSSWLLVVAFSKGWKLLRLVLHYWRKGICLARFSYF